jgi:parvulin-like peptidyl-prolyl isomerase
MATRIMVGLAVVVWLLGNVRGVAGVAPPSSEGVDAQTPAGPGRQPVLTPETVTADTVMAEVNGVKITFGELSKSVRERIPNVTGHGTISAQHLRQRAFEVLEEMISTELVRQEAARLHMTVDQKRVDAELNRQRGLFASDEKYHTALQERHLTEQQFRHRLEQAMLIPQVTELEVDDKVTVTDEDLAAYYSDHKEKFKIPMQYRLRILLVSVDPSASPDEWEHARKRAVEYRTRGLKGEDFGALARQFSGDSETRNKGGDTGLIHHGQLGLGEVEDAAERLKPGEISEPIMTIYGYYLAQMVEERPGRQQTFEELNKKLFRQELTDAKRRERYQQWMNALHAKARITRFSDTPGAP